MSLEAHPSLERVYYEAWLYGPDVYYGFGMYCFWRTVVATQNPDWLKWVPAYFLQERRPFWHTPEGERIVDNL
jgi:hypothetical protein